MKEKNYNYKRESMGAGQPSHLCQTVWHLLVLGGSLNGGIWAELSPGGYVFFSRSRALSSDHPYKKYLWITEDWGSPVIHVFREAKKAKKKAISRGVLETG